MRTLGWPCYCLRGEFLFSFDLKGYHHVEIAKTHTKYLGFSWGGNSMSSLSSHLAWPQPVAYSLSCSDALFAIGNP